MQEQHELALAVLCLSVVDLEHLLLKCLSVFYLTASIFLGSEIKENQIMKNRKIRGTKER
jgi:hypothetical protein